MSKRDDFDPGGPLPIFLAGEPGQQWGETFWDRAMSRVLKACILVATATAIGIAIQLVGKPETLFAYLAASAVEKSAIEPGTGRSTPTIQAITDAQALPAAGEAPARDEIAATSESVSQSQKEIRQPSPEALFKQFEAWADKDAQAQAWVGSVQSVEDAPAQAAKNAPPRPIQKHRHVRPVHRTRTGIPPAHRKKVLPDQNARVPVAPIQDSTQDHSAQNAQAPSFLPTFGWRN